MSVNSILMHHMQLLKNKGINKSKSWYLVKKIVKAHLLDKSFQYLARESYKETISYAHTHNCINKGMKLGKKKDVECQPLDFQWNMKIVAGQRSK